MFESWAHLYDDVYAARGKDYRKEAEYLRAVIGVAMDSTRVPESSPPAGSFESGSGPPPTRLRLLDVACGTGLHLRHLSQHFAAQGLDRSPEMLRVAREHLPSTRFHQADMTRFQLRQTFDVVTCLFSSVGYLDGPEDLNIAIATMAEHVSEGGCLLVEPPVSRERVQPPEVSEDVFFSGGRQWRRKTDATLDGPLLRIRFLYSRAGQEEPNGAVDEPALRDKPLCDEQLCDEQPIYLFTDEEMKTAFQRAGLEWSRDPKGPSGLGLHVGSRRS